MAILISDITYTTANSGSSNTAALTITLPSSNVGDGLVLLAYARYSGSGIRVTTNSAFFTSAGFTSVGNPGSASNGYIRIWEAVSNGNMVRATVEPDGAGTGEFSAIALRVKGSQRIRLFSTGYGNTAASGSTVSTTDGTVPPTHDGGLQITLLGVNQATSYVNGDQPTGYTFIAGSNTSNTWFGVAAIEKPVANNLGYLVWNKSSSGNRRMQTQYMEPDVSWAGVKTLNSGSEVNIDTTTKQRLQNWDHFTYLAKTNQEVYEFGVRIGSSVGDGKGVEIGLYNVTNGYANAALIANGTLGTLTASQYNTVTISPVTLIANNKYAVGYRANSVTNVGIYSNYQDNGAGQGVLRQSSKDGSSALSTSWDFDNGSPAGSRQTLWASIREIILRLDDVNVTESVVAGQKSVIATGSLLSGQTIQIISGTRSINTTTVSSTNTTLTFDVPYAEALFLSNVGFGNVSFNIASNAAVGINGTLNTNSSFFIHTASDVSQNANSGSIYYNIFPAVSVGDKFYLPANTSLGNQLIIDSQGFPTINNSVDVTEYFKYRIYDIGDSTWGSEGTFISLGPTQATNGISRTIRFVPSEDGIRYSKYPAGGTYTPVSSLNFNSYADGASLNGTPFGSAGRTKANTTTKYGSSGASALMSIRTGDGGGFGNWGGIYDLPTTLSRGDEIWVRWRQYWPSTFAFSATPAMKFLRFRMFKSAAESAVNAGYMDLYINEEVSWGSWSYGTIREFNNNNIWKYSVLPIPKNQWITYEVYCKLDVKESMGGSGVLYRFWVDGNLVQERTAADTGTMDETTNIMTSIYWFTYWNNETPPDNDTYVDDIVIATNSSPPYRSDSGRRKFIGT